MKYSAITFIALVASSQAIKIQGHDGEGKKAAAAPATAPAAAAAAPTKAAAAPADAAKAGGDAAKVAPAAAGAPAAVADAAKAAPGAPAAAAGADAASSGPVEPRGGFANPKQNFDAEPAISDQIGGTISSNSGDNISTHNPNSPQTQGQHIVGTTIIGQYDANGKEIKEKVAVKVAAVAAPDAAAAPPKAAALLQLEDEGDCEAALDVSQRQLDIELDYFSRKFELKHYNNARIIYDALLLKGEHPRVSIHTWELYDNAFAFSRVRRYDLVQHHMDLIQHFEDNLNSNFTNSQHLQNFMEVAKAAQSALNAKYHNGEFRDPAGFDPEEEHPVTWANVKL